MKSIKPIIIIIALMDFINFNVYGQKKRDDKIELYKVWIKCEDERAKGFLYDVNENGITISNTKTIGLDALMFVPAEKMKVVKIRKRGAIAKSTLLGALGAAAVGFTLGYSGDGSSTIFGSKAEQGSIFGAFFAIPGGISGALLGSSKKKIRIDYKVENFVRQQDLIKVHSMKYRLQSAGL